MTFFVEWATLPTLFAAQDKSSSERNNFRDPRTDILHITDHTADLVHKLGILLIYIALVLCWRCTDLLSLAFQSKGKQ